WRGAGVCGGLLRAGRCWRCCCSRSCCRRPPAPGTSTWRVPATTRWAAPLASSWGCAARPTCGAARCPRPPGPSPGTPSPRGPPVAMLSSCFPRGSRSRGTRDAGAPRQCSPVRAPRSPRTAGPAPEPEPRLGPHSRTSAERARAFGETSPAQPWPLQQTACASPARAPGSP
ncbi:neuropeptide W preproprotein, partial [Daubentonia madagascariensis]